MNVVARLSIVIFFSAVIVAACGSDDDTLSTPTEASPPVTAAPTEAPPTAIAAPTEAPPTAATRAEGVGDELFPDVIDATAVQSADGTWNFDVTMTSPYDSDDRYADAWRVLDADANELGVRVLTHGHAGEQPFTRSLSGVDIPDAVDSVIIEGRDQVNGWGGATVEVALTR